MNTNTQKQFTAKANILKALAHPTRLFIVDKLKKREHCVCELTEMIGADTSTVSKHLTVLRNAGIVNDQKEGAKVFYKLKVTCVLDFMTCIDKILLANIKEQQTIFSIK
jgi:DNA-binding transcriptional ArsR family regulator